MYRQTMLNAMTKLAWKMLAIPSAKHKNIHSTPVLYVVSVMVQIVVLQIVRQTIDRRYLAKDVSRASQTCAPSVSLTKVS